jgi:hypothetical protein
MRYLKRFLGFNNGPTTSDAEIYGSIYPKFRGAMKRLPQ